MTKGLKQMVAEATQTAQPEPVEISDEAVHALSQMVREWSGWPNASLKIGRPTGSPFADCNHQTRTFTANVDALILNPHRVLYTVTPFRLKQEAVLTGALLHEAGHARFTQWKPRTPEQARANPLRHSDGTEPSDATIKLAILMDEPRVEGLMAAMSGRIGAAGLAWTMRASAAHLLPVTKMSLDPNRAVMDFITSWALRAGRQYAMYQRTGFEMRQWAKNFSLKTREVIEGHLAEISTSTHPDEETAQIMDSLHAMIRCDDHTGPTMLDLARDVLDLLFPETPPEEQPEAKGGCTQQQDSEPEEQDEEPEEQPESGEQEPDEGDSPEDPAEPGDEGSEGESDEPEVSDESDTDGDGDTEGDESESDDAESDQDPEDESEGDESEGEGQPEENPLAEALREMEAAAAADSDEQSEEEIDADPMNGAGAGGEGNEDGAWRAPSKTEREVQRGAERFLRNVIAPSETSKTGLSDSPSATVDAAALAAWKAGGMVRDPRFFRRTHRSVETSPPVKVAILVDVSGSMEQLQKPSALLSWALSAAALDLRNFAGRGQQIESCLIHWGSTARVIVKNGEVMPGIREFECYEGTSAMGEALELVEEQIPGFFDLSERPENRLLVQFTDWELTGVSRRAARNGIHRALAAGVNMMSVVPGGDGRWNRGYSERHSDLPGILSTAPVQRGASTLLRYNPMFPDQVWEHAAKTLA